MCPFRSDNDTLTRFELVLVVYYGPAILITGKMGSGCPNFTIFSLANDLRCVQLDDIEVFYYNVGSIYAIIKDLTLT